MRELACGLLLLATLAAPVAAQAPDEAQGVPPGKTRSLFPSKEPWPTLEEARTASQCDAESAQMIAEIKAADPEQDAGKQAAAGDFTLKGSQKLAQILQTHVDGPFELVFNEVLIGAPTAVHCKLPIPSVHAFPLVHRAAPRIRGTW